MTRARLQWLQFLSPPSPVRSAQEAVRLSAHERHSDAVVAAVK